MTETTTKVHFLVACLENARRPGVAALYRPMTIDALSALLRVLAPRS